MKKIALLLFCASVGFSTVSAAQVKNDLQLQHYLEQNSKLYSVFNQHENMRPLAREIFTGLRYRLANYSPMMANDDIVKSKGLIFCAEVGAGMILVNGKLYACEVFDIVNQQIGKNNFLWAYGTDFQLRSERSKILDHFNDIIEKGLSVLKLNELFVLSGTVGVTIGYSWGDDYSHYKDLTLKKGFEAKGFQVVNGWGAGLEILSPKKDIDDIHVVLGSVLYGTPDTGLTQSTVKFRKSIQLKAKDF